jgi:Na+/H+ antiporter NhaD/arsenite permease-like protein
MAFGWWLAASVAGVTSFAASEATAAGVDGAALGPVWVLPFTGLLLSIALLPLVAHRLWHHHYGKIAAGWALAFLVPFAALFGVGAAAVEIIHVLALEYIPFIALVGALFVVCGGVRLAGDFAGRPSQNTAILAFGTALASVVGTTGAAILLLPLLIQANRWRQRRAHLIVFFILLVGNIGGSLTPIGDPPLFVGFLKGVDFFWTAEFMLAPMLVCAVPLLAVFHFWDRRQFAREAAKPPRGSGQRVRIEGFRNLLALIAIVAIVMISGTWRPGVWLTIGGVPIEGQNLVRTLALVAIAWASWHMTRTGLRKANDFTWEPIREVAKLFLAIFLTIVPVLAIIRAGEGGAAAPLIALLNQDGQPVPAMYFWATGLLSAFLDNAPTYLVFFELAGGDADRLMGPLATTLTAISAGAVFMGALTYIGNAPNFLIKAMAENQGIRMPGFFAFLGLASLLLLPLLVAVTLVFFTP